MITLQTTVERMKREIVEDVRCGRVPDNVGSFGSLHDYVDANEYGGFCEDGFSEAYEAQLGLTPGDGMSEETMEFFNACQDEVDAWIKTGAIPVAVQLLDTIRLLDTNDCHYPERSLDLIGSLRDECKRWAMRYNALKQENYRLQGELAQAKIR